MPEMASGGGGLVQGRVCGEEAGERGRCSSDTGGSYAIRWTGWCNERITREPGAGRAMSQQRIVVPDTTSRVVIKTR